MRTDAPMDRRWSRIEYERLVALEVLHEDEPIELIGGQMIVAEPKGSPHQTAIGLTAEALRAAFGSGWIIREHGPIALDDDSEPEPDVSVVRGRWRDSRGGHPARAALIVEVSESRLAFDRRDKASLYARGGIADYWIVNLKRRVLEVHRDPALAPSARFGWSYARVHTLRENATVSPLALAGATIAVADMLP